MKTTFSYNEMLLNQIVLHSFDNPDEIGLLKGQMGIVIADTRYARTHNIPLLEEAADKIFENIRYKALSLNNINFESGLSGIFWGIEYLVQKKILPGNTQDICLESDDRISRYDITAMTDFSLQTGLLGLWHYVWSRIQGNLSVGMTIPFPDSYIRNWLCILVENPSFFPERSFERLYSASKGILEPVALDASPFINLPKEINNLSLQNGASGYLYLNS